MRAHWIRRGRRFQIGHVAAMLAFVLGCGDDTDLPTRYPVSGTVTYNGQKLERGQITFVAQSKENPRNASGSIQDGYYTLTTATPGDGALPGEYRVAVNAKQVDSALLEAAVRKHGARPYQGEVGKASAKAKSLIPAKYQKPETSGIQRVVNPKANTIDLELTD